MNQEPVFDIEVATHSLIRSFKTITEHAQITIQESGDKLKLTGNCWAIDNETGFADELVITAKLVANIGRDRISNISVTPQESGWLFSADIKK